MWSFNSERNYWKCGFFIRNGASQEPVNSYRFKYNLRKSPHVALILERNARQYCLTGTKNSGKKMLASFIAILAVVGCVCGSPMANQYFDSLLNTALRNTIRMQGLDPAALPIFITKFEDKVAIIGKVKGQADYNNGTMTGLSNVRRYSECQGPYYSYGAKSVNCTIVFDKMSILYDGKLKYGKMPKVNIKARSDITTSLVFVEISQTGYNPSLKNFLYQQTGWQQVKHTGLGPLNKFMKILDDAFKQHIQAVIFNLMSQRFQNALNAAASQIPLPN